MKLLIKLWATSLMNELCLLFCQGAFTQKQIKKLKWKTSNKSGKKEVGGVAFRLLVQYFFRRIEQ